MKIGIMGGTFDPIHIGHLIAAETALDQMSLDEIWFVPSYQPPHKSDGPKASAQNRFEMVNKSIENNIHFKIKDIEMKNKKTSYTIYTAQKLRKEYPECEFYYIIGADMVQYLPQWYKIDELMGLVSFIGMNRGGFILQWDKIPGAFQEKIQMLTMPMIEISSTEIRARCLQHRSIKYLVTEQVAHYIEVNKLYV